MTTIKKQPPMSDSQCIFIVELFEPNMEVLLDKSNKANASKLKRETWRRIADELNNKFPFNPRDWSAVKKKWENMCSQAKKWTNDCRKSLKKTGGGPPIVDPPSYIKSIAEMLGNSEAFTGVGNPIESGALSTEPSDGLSTELNPSVAVPSTQQSESELPGEQPAVHAEYSSCTPKRVLSKRRKEENSVENLHKEVLILEKEKLELEVKKLRLEIDYLETKTALLRKEANRGENIKHYHDMDTNKIVLYDSTNERLYG